MATQDLIPPAAAQAAGFERREWDVIALARRDRVDSLAAPGRLTRALRTLFGVRAEHRLADPRLEALRRLAVLAWHYSYAVPVSAMRDFLSAGFSKDQLELLLASIATRRAQTRRGVPA